MSNLHKNYIDFKNACYNGKETERLKMEDYIKESRKRIEEITKELNREKFLRWASTNISCLRDLNNDELKALRYHYENAESWRKVVDSTFSMAINHLNGNVDYSNDLEKNRNQANIAIEKLNDYINFLEEKHKIIQPIKKSQENSPKR